MAIMGRIRRSPARETAHQQGFTSIFNLEAELDSSWPSGISDCAKVAGKRLLATRTVRGHKRRAQLVVFPIVMSSLRPPKARALARVLGSLPKVKGAGLEKAFALKNGVVNGFRSRPFDCLTPGITFTRAPPVK